MASRSSVVKSSSDGKIESSSESCVYIEIRTSVSASARLIVIRMSSSSAGRGSTIITTTITTANAIMRSLCFRMRPRTPRRAGSGDRHLRGQAQLSARREVR